MPTAHCISATLFQPDLIESKLEPITSSKSGLNDFLRPEAIIFFQGLPEKDKEQYEGLSGFALATAIEERYELFSLDHLLTTLPSKVRKQLGKLPDNARYFELRKLRASTELSVYSTERQQVKKTKDYISANANQAPQQQSLFAPYPHSLARRSVFFIEENENMQQREFLSGFVIGAGPWGLTTYTGRKLFTADEKAWVVLLGIAGEQRKRGIVDWHAVKGSIRSFLRKAGLSESGHYSERFVESIQAMHGGVFQFEGKEVQSKDKKRSFKERIEGWHLISSYSVDKTTGEFVVILDRAFIETFVTEFHMYAKLDIQTFCRQPPTASALNRFFTGHTPDSDGCIRMNLLLVARATNMLNAFGSSLDKWPDSEVKYVKKRIIERALRRLVQDNTFGLRTGIRNRKRGEDDLVVIDYAVSGKTPKTRKKKLTFPRPEC